MSFRYYSLLGAAGLSALAALAGTSWYSWSWRQRKPLRVLITGAAGQIGYALAPLVARGHMFGQHQPVILHLLDIEPAKAPLEGLKMELTDAAYPLLHGVVVTTDVEEACRGVDVAVMLGGSPRKAGEERSEVMARNVRIYSDHAAALAAHASPDVKVVVVANPANTNAFVLQQHAASIPACNISCLTRLDHNRALGQIAAKTGRHVTEVRNVIVWGNHSSTQFPDVAHGTVAGQPIPAAVADEAYLKGEFISTVQQRGSAVIMARGLSSALSAASAVCDHVHDWLCGTPRGTWVSMGVVSDGSYGVPPGLVFSYPVTCSKGRWSIVRGLSLDDWSWERLRATENELLGERQLAVECLGGE